MRRRVKAIALAAEKAGFSPFLPLAAGMLIALFAVSLAMAEPRNGDAVVAAHETVSIGSGVVEGGLVSDALPAGTEVSTSSSPRQHYPDRYEFYHRYDRGVTSHSNPYDDGMN